MQALSRVVKEQPGAKNEVYKIEILMKQAKISTDMRAVVPAANELAEKEAHRLLPLNCRTELSSQERPATCWVHLPPSCSTQ